MLGPHLVTNRGENPVIIIQSQPPVHDGEPVLVRTVQYSQSHVNHLQVLAPSGRGEELRSSPDVIDDGVMEPWHSGMEWNGTGIKMDVVLSEVS